VTVRVLVQGVRRPSPGREQAVCCTDAASTSCSSCEPTDVAGWCLRCRR
jgi:hypothetical protein